MVCSVYFVLFKDFKDLKAIKALSGGGATRYTQSV